MTLSPREVIADTRKQMAQSGFVDNARDMADRMKKLGYPTEFLLLEEDNHRSSVPAALMRSMPLFFHVGR